MNLIKFLLFRDNKISILASRKYGETKYTKPKETSVLASRQYGKDIKNNSYKLNHNQLL